MGPRTLARGHQPALPGGPEPRVSLAGSRGRTLTRRGRAAEAEAEIGGMQPQAEDTWGHQQLEAQEGSSPRASGGGTALPTPGFWTCGPRTGRECGFVVPSLPAPQPQRGNAERSGRTFVHACPSPQRTVVPTVCLSPSQGSPPFSRTFRVQTPPTTLISPRGHLKDILDASRTP